MDYENVMFKAVFTYTRVPKIMRSYAKNAFMRLRNKSAEVFNEEIEKINKLWDETGKPASFGQYVEDINPEYVEHIQKYINPILDKRVNTKSRFVKIFVGEYGDLYGAIKQIPESKIQLSLKEIK